MVLSNSRFRLTPTISVDGITTFGSWVQPSFMSKAVIPTGQKYRVPTNMAGRADLISNEVYGTPEYFWAIVAYNSPRDSLNWPAAGDIIDIPGISDLVAEF